MPDTDLRIHAANAAYTAATFTTEADLSGVYLFDAFPDNPADRPPTGRPTCRPRSSTCCAASAVTTWASSATTCPTPTTADVRQEGLVSPLNVPLRDADGRLVGVLHHVEDITDLDGLLAGDTRDAPDVEAGDQAVRAENRNLRLALRTRGDIEQAKGILIGQRGCTPDDAFALLVELSQATNTKFHVVAQALVDETLRRAAGNRPFSE
ncbi:ANTAR domain-containing protein [Amycolatopsis sp. CA-126428]|uniref:ANTAR domain-containing protein n=1 Tax=Amycolatopsis sp. CA-126428 TaxID=2073158 RepID=UPI0018EACF5C|nr:ANTAR domain-containing protein [Amycolatopsis sp. CA-126428]